MAAQEQPDAGGCQIGRHGDGGGLHPAAEGQALSSAQPAAVCDPASQIPRSSILTVYPVTAGTSTHQNSPMHIDKYLCLSHLWTGLHGLAQHSAILIASEARSMPEGVSIPGRVYRCHLKHLGRNG